MAEGGGIVEEEPTVWENNLQEQRDEVKQQQELISPKGPVGGAIFVASYLLLIFRVEQLVTSTIIH